MVYESTYKDQKAIALENGSLRCLFLPDTGASLASVYLKEQSRELLVQRPEPNYRRVPFGGSYVDAECSGMDDMFPTIDACYYERFPWSGVKLADHGEVWNLPFAADLSETDVMFSARGIRLPYLFMKRACFHDDRTLRLEYCVENPTAFDMDYLWAGHLMLRACPGVTLETPEGCDRAQAVFSYTGSIGEYADEFVYPAFTDARGVKRDMSRVGEVDGNCEKFYFKDRLTQGSCRLCYPDGLIVEVGFPADRVPFLGILINTGGFRNICNVFIEPCTAPFDRPDVARLMGKGSVVPAKSAVRWHMDLRIAKEGTGNGAQADEGV